MTIIFFMLDSDDEFLRKKISQIHNCMVTFFLLVQVVFSFIMVHKFLTSVRHTHELTHFTNPHTRHIFKFFLEFIPGPVIIINFKARGTWYVSDYASRAANTLCVSCCSWHGGACLMWWLFLLFHFKAGKCVSLTPNSLAEKWRWFIAYFNFIRGFHCCVVRWEWSMIIVVNVTFLTWIIIDPPSPPPFVYIFWMNLSSTWWHQVGCVVNHDSVQEEDEKWFFQLSTRLLHRCAQLK